MCRSVVVGILICMVVRPTSRTSSSCKTDTMCPSNRSACRRPPSPGAPRSVCGLDCSRYFALAKSYSICLVVTVLCHSAECPQGLSTFRVGQTVPPFSGGIHPVVRVVLILCIRPSVHPRALGLFPPFDHHP